MPKEERREQIVFRDVEASDIRSVSDGHLPDSPIVVSILDAGYWLERDDASEVADRSQSPPVFAFVCTDIQDEIYPEPRQD